MEREQGGFDVGGELWGAGGQGVVLEHETEVLLHWVDVVVRLG